MQATICYQIIMCPNYVKHCTHVNFLVLANQETIVELLAFFNEVIPKAPPPPPGSTQAKSTKNPSSKANVRQDKVG